MTWRSLLVGALLALLIAVGTYFNDAVIRQTYLIGNHLPVGVFGIAIALLLFYNPLARRFGQGAALQPSELAVITALGLAACAWPGSNLYRCFTTIVGLPSYWLNTNPSWQAAGVMSYVPGGSPVFAAGHISDWQRLATGVLAAEDPVAARLAAALNEDERRLFEAATAAEIVESDVRRGMLNALNRVLQEVDLADGSAVAEPAKSLVAANRRALVAALPAVLMPAPSGSGVLLLDGEPDRVVVDTLIRGADAASPLGPTELPWSAWWPTLRLWGSIFLLLAIATLCLTMILLPQWSQRELLPFPIARLILDLTEPSADQPGVPKPLTVPMFWYGLAAAMALHLINGYQAWHPTAIAIPLSFDFTGLSALNPLLWRVPQSGVMTPHIFLSAVAFAYFLNSRVSFSAGISQVLWTLLGLTMLAGGVTLKGSYIGAEMLNLMLFGSYLASALVILFVGRAYYLQVFRGMLGLPTDATVTPTTRWAARLMVLSLALMVAVLSANGVPAGLAALCILLVMVLTTVMTRVNVETGIFFLQAYWQPIAIIVAVLGIQSVGPTPYIVLAIFSILVVGDPRESLMPYLANGLMMTERASGCQARTSGGLLGLAVIGSLLVALGVTLTFQYNRGVNQSDQWAQRILPSMPFGELTTHVNELQAYDELSAATGGSALDRLRFMRPQKGAIGWMGLGFILVLACSFARLRFNWWPLHPVIFLIWGTFPLSYFWFSLLFGWLIKASVVRLGGVRTYNNVKPLMLGIIAGELLASLGWILFGLLYFHFTGLSPVSYRVFPG